jgi:hypothetical protein
MSTSLCIQIFHCWNEQKQRAIVPFLLKENANADNIRRRLQAQFTDDAYSIRNVSSAGKGGETSMTMRGQVPADRLCQHQNLGSIGESYFIPHIHSLSSWVFLIQQLFTT